MDYPPLEQQLGMFAKPRMDNKKIKHSYRDVNQDLCDYIDLVNKSGSNPSDPEIKISEIKALFSSYSPTSFNDRVGRSTSKQSMEWKELIKKR